MLPDRFTFPRCVCTPLQHLALPSAPPGGARTPAVFVMVLAVSLALPLGKSLAAQPTTSERDELTLRWPSLLRGPVPPLAGEQGMWLPWRPSSEAAAGGWISAAEQREWDRNLQAVLEALKATPVLTEMRGFSAGGFGSLDGEWYGPPAVPGRAPLQGSLWIGTWRPEVAALEVARGRMIDTWALLINVNSVPEGPREDWMEDEGGPFFALPPVPSPLPGTIVVRGSLLVVRDDRPPPYAPVSQERVLRAFIARYADGEALAEQMLAMRRQTLADYLAPEYLPRRRAEIETLTRGFMNANRMDEASARRRAEAIDAAHIEKLEAEANPPPGDPVFGPVHAARRARERLDAMSAAERAAPAWMSASPGRGAESLFDVPLRAPDSPGSAPVMQVNPAFLDPAIPRTALRSLLLRDVERMAESLESEGSAPRFTHLRVNLLVLQQTDWPALARSVLR